VNNNLILIVLAVLVVAAFATLVSLTIWGPLTDDQVFTAISSLITLVFGALLALLHPSPPAVVEMPAAETKPPTV
jgi:hypothetical protein